MMVYFLTPFLPEFIRKVSVSPGGAMRATSAQYSAEMLLVSGGVDGPCGSGEVGVGCDDVGVNLTLNRGAYSPEHNA